jgi:hypothetical protein
MSLEELALTLKEAVDNGQITEITAAKIYRNAEQEQLEKEFVGK